MTPKDPAAVALGRKGGAAKVKKGAAMLSPEEQARRAKKGWESRKKNAKLKDLS